MNWLLYILAALLFVGGVWRLFARDYLWGAILVIAAFVAGPLAVSIYHWV